MNIEQMILFTQALVRQQSLVGEEGPVVEQALAEMQTLGFDRIWIDAQGNAIAVVEGNLSGPTLLLDAHCDTVGIAPGVPWRYDPFGAEIKDGVMYGRGTADMKGAMAAMIYAAASLDRTRLAGKVVVSVSLMEEVFEGACLRSVMEQVQPDFVVIGEATDLNLNRGGRGRAEIHLETIGRPAHSSSPHLGRNAVLDMLNVVQALEKLPLPTDPLLGSAVLALTDIISDPYPGYSVIPSRCRVTYDRRLLLGETIESVLEEFTGLPEAVGIELQARIAHGEHNTYTGVTLRGPKFFPAWTFPENHPFIQSAQQGLRSAGLNPQIGVYHFCTNAAYSAGLANIPTIGFGPATEGDAHVVDEHLSLEALVAAAKGYRGIIEATLGV